jgi:biopolymer transport protein ExbD
MNDIMFFLMLFFLIVSTMVSPSVVKLTLPSSKNAQQVTKKVIKLEISAEQRYVLQGKDVAFEELEPAMKSAVEGISEPTIVLSLDKSLSIQQLVDVLEIGNRLKIKMILATKAPNG